MKAKGIPVTDYLPKPGHPVLVRGTSGWVEVMHIVIEDVFISGVDSNGRYIKTPYWYPGGCPIVNTVCWCEIPEF